MHLLPILVIGIGALVVVKRDKPLYELYHALCSNIRQGEYAALADALLG